MRTQLMMTLTAAATLLAAPAALAGPPHKTPELLQKGKASYEMNCASCHAGEGAIPGEGEHVSLVPLSAAPCHRSPECCTGNLCDAGRCCAPVARTCASPGECCSGLCGLYQNGAGGAPHCCGGPGGTCRLDQASTC